MVLEIQSEKTFAKRLAVIAKLFDPFVAWSLKMNQRYTNSSLNHSSSETAVWRVLPLSIETSLRPFHLSYHCAESPMALNKLHPDPFISRACPSRQHIVAQRQLHLDTGRILKRGWSTLESTPNCVCSPLLSSDGWIQKGGNIH